MTKYGSNIAGHGYTPEYNFNIPQPQCTRWQNVLFSRYIYHDGGGGPLMFQLVVVP